MIATFGRARARGIGVLLAVLAAGCDRGDHAPGPAAATAQTYTLRGVVRDVDPQAGSILIAHEEVPGFMTAMTMEFAPVDRSNLGEIEIGDTVEGPLVVERENGANVRSELRSVHVIKHADPNAAVATPPPRRETLAIGRAVPDFAMTTQDGERRTLSSMRGKVVVLTFVYTRCPMPEYCPAMDKKFRELADKLGAVKDRAGAVRLVSVSFDSANDTPAVLREHAALAGAKPPLWTYAAASDAELAKIGGALGLTYGPVNGTFAHNLCTAVIAPDGSLARLELGGPTKSWTADDLIPLIVKLASAARRP